MPLLRYVAIDANNLVYNITETEDAAFAAYMGWIQSDTATFGDLWTGTEFITPPPPTPTNAQMDFILKNYLAYREQQKMQALRAQIAASVTPPLTEQSFTTAMENWDYDA